MIFKSFKVIRNICGQIYWKYFCHTLLVILTLLWSLKINNWLNINEIRFIKIFSGDRILIFQFSINYQILMNISVVECSHDLNRYLSYLYIDWPQAIHPFNPLWIRSIKNGRIQTMGNEWIRTIWIHPTGPIRIHSTGPIRIGRIQTKFIWGMCLSSINI